MPSFDVMQNLFLTVSYYLNLKAASLRNTDSYSFVFQGFPGGTVVKKPSATVGDPGSIPGLGRTPGGGHGNPLHNSYLENPMDRET